MSASHGIAAFIMANVLLWGAFSVTVYNFVTVSLTGGLFDSYGLMALLLVVCVVFSYLTKVIIEKA